MVLLQLHNGYYYNKIANMEIKWIWISKQFIYRYSNNFMYYITSLSYRQEDGKVCKKSWVGQLSSPCCAVHNPKMNSHEDL